METAESPFYARRRPTRVARGRRRSANVAEVVGNYEIGARQLQRLTERHPLAGLGLDAGRKCWLKRVSRADTRKRIVWAEAPKASKRFLMTRGFDDASVELVLPDDRDRLALRSSFDPCGTYKGGLAQPRWVLDPTTCQQPHCRRRTPC